MPNVAIRQNRTIAAPPQLPDSLVPLVDLKCGINAQGYIRDAWHRPTWIPARFKPALATSLEEHEAAMAPAPRDFIAAHLARLAVHHGMKRTEAEWAIIAEDMLEDLAELPVDVVLEVIRQHRRTSPFFPKSSELLKLAEPIMGDRRYYIKRMCHLLTLPTNPQSRE